MRGFHAPGHGARALFGGDRLGPARVQHRGWTEAAVTRLAAALAARAADPGADLMPKTFEPMHDAQV